MARAIVPIWDRASGSWSPKLPRRNLVAVVVVAVIPAKLWLIFNSAMWVLVRDGDGDGSVEPMETARSIGRAEVPR
jgi:hypothetical protein